MPALTIASTNHRGSPNNSERQAARIRNLCRTSATTAGKHPSGHRKPSPPRRMSKPMIDRGQCQMPCSQVNATWAGGGQCSISPSTANAPAGVRVPSSRIVVVGATRSTMKSRLAGVGSVPFALVARTRKLCAPGDSTPLVWGEVQGTKGALS